MRPFALRTGAVLAGIAAIWTLGCLVAPVPAAAQADRMTKAYSGPEIGRASRPAAPAEVREAASRVAERYGVRLLAVRVVDVNGKRAYEASVMNPGGDFNEAFQVTRLLIDPATGDLLSGFRHLPDGHRFSAASPGQAEGFGSDAGSAARRASGRN